MLVVSNNVIIPLKNTALKLNPFYKHTKIIPVTKMQDFLQMVFFPINVFPKIFSVIAAACIRKKLLSS